MLAGGAITTKNFDLGSGPFSLFVGLYFIGLPLWVLSASITLLVRRAPVVGDSAAGPVAQSPGVRAEGPVPAP